MKGTATNCAFRFLKAIVHWKAGCFYCSLARLIIQFYLLMDESYEWEGTRVLTVELGYISVVPPTNNYRIETIAIAKAYSVTLNNSKKVEKVCVLGLTFG